MARTSAGPGSTRAQHSFAQIPRAEIQRSVFDRSCGMKTTFDAGYLIPVFVDEALPGDTFKMRMAAMARMSTPLFPVMDNVFMDFFFFFIPNRLIWDNWAKFCGEQANPGDSTDFLVPIMNEVVSTGSLSDYFGMPLSVSGYDHVSLFHRAYSLVWREWFRDENLQDSPVVDLDDGPDDPADYPLRRRGKRHDYFTSCLPFTQKGDPVGLPLGSVAPVVANAVFRFEQVGDATRFGQVVNTPGGIDVSQEGALWGNAGEALQYRSGLETDLSGATAATINQIREAFQIQRLLERDARGGTRYTEIVRSHFGVVSPDARLQRPEYLGGGSTRVNVHPVPRTTSAGIAADQPPAANLGGFATASADGIGFNKSFTEHGIVLGLVNVRADLTYQQGLERMFFRRTRYEYYWPAFAHLGEQAVLNKEIFLQDTAADEQVFGYQERYAEYRYKPSRVSGLFRSDAAVPLDPWHLALDFSALPVLNEVFIADDPPIDRVIATPSQPHFIGDFWFQYRCARPMPVFSVPGMVDHF